MLTVTSLPAGEGDALWLEWGTSKKYRMIVDMGRSRHGKEIRERFDAMDPSRREVELMIISHVDRDHIEGVLSGFVEQDENLDGMFRSIWFNGWNHLHGLDYKEPSPPFKRFGRTQQIGGGIHTFGAVQGEKLTPWLAKTAVWNSHFDGMPVIRPFSKINAPIKLRGGLSVTILGPTQKILSEFIKTWREKITKFEQKHGHRPGQVVGEGMQVFGRDKTKPRLSNMADLIALADLDADEEDDSIANKTSISIVVEYKGKRVLLAGDAHADDLNTSLNLLPLSGRTFDLVKLPHHGSAKNISAKLMQNLDCSRFLISTSGSYFKHPDAEAIARIIYYSKADKPELLFNVPSRFNKWWDNADWQSKFGYAATYGDEVKGLRIEV